VVPSTIAVELKVEVRNEYDVALAHRPAGNAGIALDLSPDIIRVNGLKFGAEP
jgi:hypothetical protein